MVFKSSKKFPGNTKVTVTVGPGIPSAEGPDKSEATSSFSFTTEDDFAITSFYPASDKDRYTFDGPMILRFSHPIDPTTFNPDKMIVIEPPLPGRKVTLSDNHIEVLYVLHFVTFLDLGYTRGKPRYRIQDQHLS